MKHLRVVTTSLLTTSLLFPLLLNPFVTRQVFVVSQPLTSVSSPFRPIPSPFFVRGAGLMSSTVSGLVSILARVGMAVCPTMGYIHQILLITRLKSTDAYDHFASFIVLNSSILRIYFWFLKRFDVALLVQSILQVLVHIVILWFCAKYPKKKLLGSPILDASDISNEVQPRLGSIRDGYKSFLRSFWNWRDFESYMLYVGLIVAITGFFSFFLSGLSLYVEALGMISLLFDAVIGLPQLIRNFRRKDVEGLSLVMLSLWLGGDFVKLIYFFIFSSPIQFIFGALLQTCIEGTLFVTFFVYSGRSGTDVPPTSVPSFTEEVFSNDDLVDVGFEIDADVDLMLLEQAGIQVEKESAESTESSDLPTTPTRARDGEPEPVLDGEVSPGFLDVEI